MISEATIAEVRQKADIVAVIGEVVQLQKKGSAYFGLCPFHGEKTPSFSVQDSGYFKCFGCGESGNIFSFLMKQRGLSFPEAVEELASQFGVAIQYTQGRKRESHKPDHSRRLHELLGIACQFFQYALGKAPEPIKQYVAERGLLQQTIDSYHIGYAPDDWSALLKVLRKKEFSDEEILLSGMARRSPKGELYDTFRGRLVFPVHTSTTRIAGFGGRVVGQQTDKSIPKYINSPESPVYQKSKILYGVPQASFEIRQTQLLYLVEGYMDVVSLAQNGLNNVVATCGTAVAGGHVKKLQRITKRVRVLFDGDSAGRKAAAKLLPLFQGSGVDVEVLFLPDGEDPDTLARQAAESGEPLSTLLEGLQRSSLFTCYLHDLVSSHGATDPGSLGSALKGQIAEQIAHVIQAVKNPIERNEMEKEVVSYLGVELEAFRQMAPPEEAIRVDRDPLSSEEEESQLAITPLEELPVIDKTLLHIAMVKKEELPKEILHSPEWCSLLHQSTLSFITELQQIMSGEDVEVDEKKEGIQELLNRFGKDWIAHWKRAYQMKGDDAVSFDKEYTYCLAERERLILLRQLQGIKEELSSAVDDEERLRLTGEHVKIMKKIDLLRA